MMWRSSANNFRPRRRLPFGKKLVLLVVVLASIISLGTSVLAPKTSSANTGRYNVMQLLGEHCHDLHDITYDFPNLSDVTTKAGDWGFSSRCHYDGQGYTGTNSGNTPPGWQENLNKALGCGTGMFYSHDFQTDPTDNTVTKTLWFTDIGQFKSCWQKAQAMEQTMTDTSNNGPCHDMKKGSKNWDDCQQDQENLYWAIGCDSDSMFKPTGNDHYDINKTAANNCAQRVNDIGNMTIKIIGPDGTIQNSAQIKDASVQASGANTADGGGSADSNQIGCEFSPNALSWIICPTVDLLSTAISATDKIITQQLTVPTDNIFCSKGSSSNDSCQSYYTAWASFRNIALGFLVIVGLIVVISQAIGMEILDAYTIRKMLPRILVAAIGITLSWTLMNFAVMLSNDLGYGVRALIVAPFHNLDSQVDLSFLGSSAPDIIGGFSVFIIGGTLIAIGGLGVLLSYVLTAGLAVLIAIMVLVLRQIAITLLLILSPVALIAYVLPNTQRVFRLWWESFSRALLMFPLIVAFIASGRVFAAIALSNSSDGTGNLFFQLTGIVSYFAPYFMIPLTFRLSGSMMGGLGNFVNQRAQPGFAFLKKRRGEKYAANWKKARAGQRWDENFARFKNPVTGNQTGIGHLANRLAVNVSDQDEYLPYRLGKPRDITNPLTGRKWGGMWGFRKGSAHLQDQLDDNAIQQSQKALEHIPMHYEAWRGVSGQMMDYTGRVTRQAADGSKYTVPVSQALAEAGFVDDKTGEVIVPRSEQDFKKMGEILQESDNDKERLGGADLLEHRGSLAAVKSGEGMEYADTQVMAAIAQAAAGRTEPEALANIGNSVKKRLGAGVAQRTMKTAQSAASRIERPDLRDGHGIIKTADGRYESAYSEKNYRSATAVGSILSVKGSAWSSAKAEAVEAAARTIKHIATGGTGDQHDQTAVQEMIRDGLRNPYNDAGQRKAWRKIAEEAGLTEVAQQQPASKADWDLQQLPDPGAAPDPGASPDQPQAP